jgi:hypothetical protein
MKLTAEELFQSGFEMWKYSRLDLGDGEIIIIDNVERYQRNCDVDGIRIEGTYEISGKGYMSNFELTEMLDVDFFVKNENVIYLTEDEINNPKHYHTIAGVKCADITDHFNFNLGCAIKYIWRAGKKEKESYIKDLKKARWYLNREIENLK